MRRLPRQKEKRVTGPLTIGSFKRHGQPGSFAHYFGHILPDGRELCLEACAGGYCVAIYDKFEGTLLSKKKHCTNLPGFVESHIAPGDRTQNDEALQRAVDIANKLLS
jgi:hypothetical protein